MTDVAALLAAAGAKGLTVATAESCTGGLVAAALTEVPGSSAVVLGGIVSYSNGLKVDLLGVPEAVLARVGAVSEEVAAGMAAGARARTGADIAVSITGIAGPGGSEYKPEGRVCFGLATAAGVTTLTREFGARGRAAVRSASVDEALAMLTRAIADADPGTGTGPDPGTCTSAS